MNNKKGFLVSFFVFFLLVGLTIPLFMSNHKKVKAETITNLTNTTWTFNNVLDYDFDAFFDINFTSNSSSFTNFEIEYDDYFEVTYNNYPNYVKAYRSGTWANENYKIIEITGGNDVTNTNFINWLLNNATLYVPTPTGTQITHRYWAPDGIITMSDDSVIGDDYIQYVVLFNEFSDELENTTQTGLIFKGVQTSQNPSWSYIESINGDGLNILYHGTTNNINNSMWLEFTPGDYLNTELYDFMDLWGTWFDDQGAYLVGMNQGYVEGFELGRSQGQADGVQYTNLVSRIFNGFGDLLSIEVFPHITIALILGLPLLLGVFVIIIKILRG